MSTEAEDKYFKRQETARRERVRRELERAARNVQESRSVAQTVRTDDDDVVERIRALGFDGDTARVFDVLPLVHVAWADGSVSSKERSQILALLERREIERDSEAFVLIESLLETRPSDAFLEETLEVLRYLTRADGARGVSIVDLCAEVADASGGFLGLGNKINDEERALIQRIADRLGGAAQSEFRKILGS